MSRWNVHFGSHAPGSVPASATTDSDKYLTIRITGAELRGRVLLMLMDTVALLKLTVRSWCPLPRVGGPEAVHILLWSRPGVFLKRPSPNTSPPASFGPHSVVSALVRAGRAIVEKGLNPLELSQFGYWACP